MITNRILIQQLTVQVTKNYKKTIYYLKNIELFFGIRR